MSVLTSSSSSSSLASASSSSSSSAAVTVIRIRNVVILGMTGSGKSNLANHILDCKELEVHHGVNSGTAKPQLAEVKHIVDGIEYHIKLMDTAGFFDTGVHNLTNEEIKASVRDGVLSRMPEGLNALILCVKKGRYTLQEKEAFNLVMTVFDDDVRDKTIVVMTHCEMDERADRDHLIAEFKQAEPFARNLKIITVGFPNFSGDNAASAAFFGRKIQEDERALKDALYRMGNQADIKYLVKKAEKSSLLEKWCSLL